MSKPKAAGLNAERAKLIWIIEVKGFGASILGRLFASNYRRNLDEAIPLLVAEMETASNETRRHS